MDNALRSLMRLNEKRRMLHDGFNVNPEEFSVFDLVEDRPPVIEIEPVSYSRERRRNGMARTGPVS